MKTRRDDRLERILRHMKSQALTARCVWRHIQGIQRAKGNLMQAKLVLAAMFGIAALSAHPALAQTSTVATKTAPITSRTIRVLPPDVSRSLVITRMPTSQPVPFLVGVYWNCSDGGNGFELCRLVTVVCTPDQSQCAEA